MFLPHPRVKVSIVGSLRDREVACSTSDRQGSNFESCVWRTVSSQSSHHPQEVLLAQFSLYGHKGGLKPDSFHFSVRSLRIFQFFQRWHRLQTLESDVYRRQILTYKDGPRTERVKHPTSTTDDQPHSSTIFGSVSCFSYNHNANANSGS